MSRIDELKDRVESSAKRSRSEWSLRKVISLMNIKNKRGPRTDPCGTPIVSAFG
jgi:hypothetical protein